MASGAPDRERRLLVDAAPSRRHALALAIGLGLVMQATQAQTADPNIEEVTVVAERIYRDREALPAPTLLYGVDYFQHFEPLALGDLLKRIPGVSFNGDLGEFDAPQLRGLAPQYTQILINGERVPGSSDNGSILVNRIPSELIERVEVVRSPTAEIDAQGVGGTINVVLKDGAGLDGGEWRLSALHYGRGSADTKGAGSVSFANADGPMSFLLAANLQRRASPKSKSELTLDADGEFEQLFQSEDLRESDDRSLLLNLGVQRPSGSRFELDASYVDTRIDEDEQLILFDEDAVIDGQRLEQENADQQRLTAELRYQWQLDSGAALELALTSGRFEERSSLFEDAIEDEQRISELTETRSTNDNDDAARLSYRIELGDHDLSAGLQTRRRERQLNQQVLERDEDEDELEDVTPGSGNYLVEQDRMDGFVSDRWRMSERLELEVGARIEHTRVTQRGVAGHVTTRYTDFSPSAHLLFEPTDSRQFRLSLARTLRRPGFDEIVPVIDRDTPAEDQFTIGNPNLTPERALGFDLGFEQRRDDGQGVMGINVFYRDIDDKIEITQLDDDLFTPANVGNGQSWGVEMDLSRPLDFIGLPNAGVYLNLAWLDSSLTDPITGIKRRFNGQPGWVGNVDLIHDLPAHAVSYGISYQQQARSTEFLSTEVSTLEFEGNLEFFVEKTTRSGVLIRFGASNLLNAAKDETTFIYDSLDDRRDHSPAQSQFEHELNGRVYMLTVRAPF